MTKKLIMAHPVLDVSQLGVRPRLPQDCSSTIHLVYEGRAMPGKGQRQRGTESHCRESVKGNRQDED